jgi:hypothetical protein
MPDEIQLEVIRQVDYSASDTPLPKLSYRHFAECNFSGRDMAGKKMDHSLFIRCCFDRSNMSNAEAEWSSFDYSSFKETKLSYTSFKESSLTGTIFEPSDAYGMTLTLQCKTFQGIRISQLWFLCWLLFGSMMTAAKYPVDEPWNDKLIALIGAERYVKLKALFCRREL